jgi:hypothetical protein
LSYVQLRDSVELWDLFTCLECDSLLEVVNLHPPTLDYVEDDYLEDEDWEDEEEWGDLV